MDIHLIQLFHVFLFIKFSKVPHSYNLFSSFIGKSLIVRFCPSSGICSDCMHGIRQSYADQLFSSFHFDNFKKKKKRKSKNQKTKKQNDKIGILVNF